MHSTRVPIRWRQSPAVDAFQGEVGPAQRDAFLTAMLNSERPPQPPAVAPPAAVAAMPGGEDLAQYGSWSDSPDYGQVWYPQVAPDWVPYREGRWAYVAPWGWTWVDNATVGLRAVPLRTLGRDRRTLGLDSRRRGRCARAGLCAGAGDVPRVSARWSASASAPRWPEAGSAGVPLGPREPFHPWYRASDRYFRQVNVTHVANFTARSTAMSRSTTSSIGGAATVVPTSAMTASRPVASSFQRVDPALLAQARPVIGQQPLRPAPTTSG